MELIKVNCWDTNVALISQKNNFIYFELHDEKFQCFSPQRFENELLVKESESELDKIGLLADAISGAYGKDYFNRFHFNNYGKQATLLERLSFIGSFGLGAIEFSPNHREESAEICISLNEFKKQSIQVYDGEESDIAFFIASSNSGAGGAKAKGVVRYNTDTKEVILSNTTDTKSNQINAIVKFNTKTGDEAQQLNTQIKLEYIYYLLAKESGLKMSDSFLEVDDNNSSYFITKRFDIANNGETYHLHSLAGLLSHNAESFTMGYELLFRVALMLSVPKENMIQIYKNMIFNLIYANRDDHSRNFSFLMNKECEWEYAPAYDLTYSGNNVGLEHHQLTINKSFAKTVKSLGLVKIAKLGGIKEPIEIIKEMLSIKHKRLKSLCEEYGLSDEIAQEIFADTKDVDKRLGAI